MPKYKKMYRTVFEKMNFRNLTWGQMGKVQPPKKTFTATSAYTTLYSP